MRDALRGPLLSGWPATLLAALLLVVGVRSGAEFSARAASSMLFALGPFVLMAGLHARVEDFLHSKRRASLLNLPIEAKAHWVAASHNRRLAFAISAGIASLLLGAACFSGVIRHGPSLFFQWCAFLLLAAVLEPLVPAWSAYLGRRFEEDSPAARAQSGLGGGWTQPEAVVHLYAPALVLLAAAALAMPAQLSIERALEGQPLTDAHWGLSLGPLAIALYFRRDALAKYGAGMHEAVPWLQEAERTLSGPPTPRATPALLRGIKDPWVRTRGVSLWRSTKGATLRFLGALIAAALVWGVSAESFGVAATFSGALLVIWLAPLASLAAGRWRWEQMSRRLPCPRSPRQTDLRLGLYWGLAPTLLVLISLGLRFSTLP